MQARFGEGDTPHPQGSTVPTLPQDVQGGGQEAGGDPGRHPDAGEEWRMGRRSRSPGKPATRGILPMAKAPRLWKYGGHRSSAHTGPSARVSCPRALCSCLPAPWHPTRVKSCGCRRHGHSGFMGAPWRSTTGAEPEAVKAARPVLNGGDEETYSNATRLVPTQRGHWRRLRPGVSAPSAAWRFLQGARPCGERSHQPLIPSVAPVEEVETERHR